MQRRTVWSILLVAAALTLLTSVALAQESPESAEGKGGVKYWTWFVELGGPIAWFLILVNVGSWGAIIFFLISIREQTVVPDLVHSQIGELLEAKQYRQVIEYTSAEPSQLSYIIHQALAEAGHGYPAMERAMEEASDVRTSKLLRKIEVLNVIGNVAPMLGLLGTVYGMIMVFSKIVQEGDMPDASQLANGVGIALVTTFWGLVVAIPALAAYAVIRTRIDSLTSHTMTIAQEAVSTFRPGAKKI